MDLFVSLERLGLSNEGTTASWCCLCSVFLPLCLLFLPIKLPWLPLPPSPIYFSFLHTHLISFLMYPFLSLYFSSVWELGPDFVHVRQMLYGWVEPSPHLWSSFFNSVFHAQFSEAQTWLLSFPWLNAQQRQLKVVRIYFGSQSEE